MEHEKRDLVEACYSSYSCLDDALVQECVVHGCDGLNKRSFSRPLVLLEHTLVSSCSDL